MRHAIVRTSSALAVILLVLTVSPLAAGQRPSRDAKDRTPRRAEPLAPDRQARVPSDQIARCVRQVPDLTGGPLQLAGRVLAKVDLRPGRVSVHEADRRRATIVKQSPAAGTKVSCGTRVDLWVETPRSTPPDREPGGRDPAEEEDDGKDVEPPGPVQPCLVAVPRVEGGMLEEASRRLAGAKLRIGRIAEIEVHRRRGLVLRQSPAPGRRVLCGSALDLWIAVPPDVPRPPEPQVPPREIPQLEIPQREIPRREIPQTPPPPPVVEPPPLPPPPCVVPDLADPDPDGLRRQLAAANLALGAIRPRESERPRGSLLDQSPRPGSRVACGSLIDVWVAVPLPTQAPLPPPPCSVPQLLGSQERSAAAVLTRAGLRAGDVTPAESDRPSGSVIGQSPAAGAAVKCGSLVALQVAVPIRIEVPRLIGQTTDAARRRLADAGLVLGAVGEREAEEPARTVVDQRPQPGSAVTRGAAVHVWIATPPPALVPDLRGRDRLDAIQALRDAGLTPGSISRQPSEHPAGTVVVQAPQPGVRVARESAVRLWVAEPFPASVPSVAEPGPGRTPAAPPAPALIEVPDLRGRTAGDAERALEALGLVLQPAPTEPSGAAAAGTVVRQTPAPGGRVPPGTAVAVVLAIPAPPATVTVPHVAGLTLTDARDALRRAGLQAAVARQVRGWTVRETVASQSPEGGSPAAPGTPVNLVVAALDAAVLWLIAGAGVLLVAAGGVQQVRARSRPKPVTLKAHADAGAQVTLPDGHGPRAAELTLAGVPDAGVQTLDGPLGIVSMR